MSLNATMAADKSCTCWLGLGLAVSSCWGSSGKGRCCCPRSSKQIVQLEFPADGTQPSAQGVSSDGTGSMPSTDEIRQASLLRVFAFSDLRAATRNFRPDSKLGVGGFGSVFKGWIDEHGTSAVKPGTGLTVAVKQLNHEGPQGHREWLAEVYFLGQFHHSNLVKLIGYCIEDDHRLLVYEFLPRGSLENHLFRHGVLPLPWATRIKIAYGAAKGLAFLHGAKNPVIYRDFKTSNILLDSEYNAKLSDFGLAKDGPEGDKTHVSTRVMGTYGYAAPEYVMTGHLTSRSDVYSFGVVLLEMLTGRRSMDKSRPSGEHNLVEWARPFLSDKRRVFHLVDRRLDGQYPMKGVQKAAALANACLSRDARSRPLMCDVVTSLEPLQVTKDAQGSFHYHQATNGMKDRHRVNSTANNKHLASYQANHHHQQNAFGRHNGSTGKPSQHSPKQQGK